MIDDVALGNAPWGASPQMLTAKRIEAQVALLPLLRRRVDVVRFALIEPTISLETDGKGNGNWQIGGASGEGGGAARSPGGLAFGDLAISNGTMTYRDGATGKVTNIAIETLSLHARDPQSPISAQFRGKVDDIAVSVEGDLGPLDALLQRRWPYPVTLQGEVNGQKASVKTQMSIQGGRIGLEAMTVQTGASTITGEAAIVQQAPRNKLTFRFAAPTLRACGSAACRRRGESRRRRACGSSDARRRRRADSGRIAPQHRRRGRNRHRRAGARRRQPSDQSAAARSSFRTDASTSPRCRRRHSAARSSPICRSMPLINRRPHWRCTRR